MENLVQRPLESEQGLDQILNRFVSTHWFQASSLYLWRLHEFSQVREKTLAPFRTRLPALAAERHADSASSCLHGENTVNGLVHTFCLSFNGWSKSQTQPQKRVHNIPCQETLTNLSIYGCFCRGN